MSDENSVDRPDEEGKVTDKPHRHPITMSNSREEPSDECVPSPSERQSSGRSSVPSEKRTRVEFFLPIRTDASDYRTITLAR